MYPKSRSDLYDMMGDELKARVLADTDAISHAVITAATAGQGSVEYCALQDILEYTLVEVRTRFPDCSVFYTSSCSVKVVWVQ